MPSSATALSLPSPSVPWSLLPIAVLIGLMVSNILVFGDSATSGPNQIALMLAGAVAALIGVLRYKLSYLSIRAGILRSIDQAMGATLILLAIAALIGTWMAAGIVPTIIYYGFALIHPAVFLPVACIACALVSLATGSSWTTTGTIGVALIAIGTTYGIPAGMVAGAVISGAYFGDKMSPLSDTTNLAPAMCGVDLFEHVRYMIFTTGPAMLAAVLGFVALGFAYHGDGDTPAQVQVVSAGLRAQFAIGPHLLIVPVVVLLLVRRRVAALPALLTGALLGLVVAVVFQQDALNRFAHRDALSTALSDLHGVSHSEAVGHHGEEGEDSMAAAEAARQATIDGAWQQARANTSTSVAAQNYAAIMDIISQGFSLHSGNTQVNDLLSGGGILNMLPTVWLVLAAMVFGGALEVTGMLATLAGLLLGLAKTSTSLVATTVASALAVNATAGDQYVAIVLPARMYGDAYARRGLHPKNLSRAVEDGGTVTSVLVPWNSGGAFHAATLGVTTLTYLPFCFFNLLSPLASILIAALGWRIARLAAGAPRKP